MSTLASSYLPLCLEFPLPEVKGISSMANIKFTLQHDTR